MKALTAYRIPLKSLNFGIHQFHYELDESFFQSFDKEIFDKGLFEIDLEFDKRSNLFVLNFEINGSYQTNCDRCLALINMPVESSNRLIVKIEEGDQEDEADVTYLDPAMDFFDVSKYLYEFVGLSLPLKQVYDCALEKPLPCDENALMYLNEQENGKENQVDNPTWDILKEIKNQ